MEKSQISLNNDRPNLLAKYGFSDIKDDGEESSEETTVEVKPVIPHPEERSRLLAQIEETQKTIAELEQFSSRKRNLKKDEYSSKVESELITMGELN
jgi:hypothetical protein